MFPSLPQRLDRLIHEGLGPLLAGGRVGIERETLRVGPDGKIAQTPHPACLGAPLTHPCITTDYSEALAEFITPPLAGVVPALEFLDELHRFVYSCLEGELLWATSMPCVVEGEAGIPIAEYGSSNLGLMKTVYRRGLGYRYGRMMQVIAGVHFNYSLPEAFWPAWQAATGDGRTLRDFVSESYMGLIRNLLRVGWLVPYLFGASPAICKSFLAGQPTALEPFDPGSYYQPWATSLRMGDIGYQNNKEGETGVKAEYDSLEAYVRSLTEAITTPCPEYQRIGVVVDGEWRQLNANRLQIENEYYSTIRPKQVPEDNEKPTLALRRRGIAYVELRSLDVNAFVPLGVCENQLRFLEALLIGCLLADSPPLSGQERREVDANELVAAHRGREPGVKLARRGEAVPLVEWAGQVLDALEPVCGILDDTGGGGAYARALAVQREAVHDPGATPSARMLAEMRDRHESFFEFALRKSREYEDHFRARPLPPERQAFFENLARESHRRQAELEAADTRSFEEFLQDYFAQT